MGTDRAFRVWHKRGGAAFLSFPPPVHAKVRFAISKAEAPGLKVSERRPDYGHNLVLQLARIVLDVPILLGAEAPPVPDA